MKIIKKLIKELVKKSKNPLDDINEIKKLLHSVSPVSTQPVDLVQWVDIESVQANDYNPNSVANREMGLLYTSILHDGYTQPIVTIYDSKIKKYIIIDGFHRYFTCKNNEDILERNNGRLPVVVLEKDMNERMASTVRHNRARGSHSITGMSSMVFEMLKNGLKDAEICNELGLDKEELLRLKHITGFAKLFQDHQYTDTFKTKKQIILEKEHGYKSKLK